jgi:hypothetical protein
LGVCHIQGLHPERQEQKGVELIMKSASMGNVTAQSIAWSIHNKSNSQGHTSSQYPFEEWLAQAMRLGSFRAQGDLRSLHVDKFDEEWLVLAKIREAVAMKVLGNRNLGLPGSTTISVEDQDLDRLDPIAKALFTRPQTTRLHWLAYLGFRERCIEVLRFEAHPNIDLINCHLQTPLHYAAINGQHIIVELLLERGANANFQRQRRNTIALCLVLARTKSDCPKPSWPWCGYKYSLHR